MTRRARAIAGCVALVALGPLTVGTAALAEQVTLAFTGMATSPPFSGTRVHGAFTFDSDTPAGGSGVYPNAVSEFVIDLPAFVVVPVSSSSIVVVDTAPDASGGCEFYYGYSDYDELRVETSDVSDSLSVVVGWWCDVFVDASLPTRLPAVPFNWAYGQVSTSAGAIAFQIDVLRRMPALTRPDDLDTDGVLNSSDNCVFSANPGQEDNDRDSLGDDCDPFPNEADHEKAQCFADLGQTRSELWDSHVLVGTLQGAVAHLETAIARLEARPAFDDADGDGEEDGTDACAATPTGHSVDSAGCSSAQFCARIAVTSKLGRRLCKRADFRNDEHGEPRPGDCRVLGGVCASIR